MASFQSQYYYSLISLGGNQYQIQGEAVEYTYNFTDGQSENNFSVGETLTAVDGDIVYEDEYSGFYDNGFIGLEAGSYYFYTNDGSILSDTIFTASTEPFVVCFLAGTAVATPMGQVLVEALSVGDLVLTADGRTAPIRWVGRQSYATVFSDPLRAFPIRIAAGAIGEGLPMRDLLVSPDHALMLDGMLVQASALLNGTTIVRPAAMPERFTYFHVELDDHALILAEGVPAETFVDNVSRRRFDNYAEFEALYGETGATILELDVPRVKSSRQLPRVLRERLAQRAAVIGGANTAAA